MVLPSLVLLGEAAGVLVGVVVCVLVAAVAAAIAEVVEVAENLGLVVATVIKCSVGLLGVVDQ